MVTTPTIEKGTLLRHKDGKGRTNEYWYSHAGKKGNATIHYLRSLATGEVVKEPVDHSWLAACEIVPGTGQTAYLESFKDAVSANTMSCWQIGDLALQRDRYGLTLADLADKVGLGEQSLNTYQSVAKSYSETERLVGVSFSHHQACQGNANRKELLHQAKDGAWTVSQLKEKARETKTSNAGRKARTPGTTTVVVPKQQPAQTAQNQPQNQTGLTPAPSANAAPLKPAAPLAGGTLDSWTEGQCIVLDAKLSAWIHEQAGGGYSNALKLATELIAAGMSNPARTSVQTAPAVQPAATAKPAQKPKDAKQSIQTAPNRFGNLELNPVPSAA